MKRVVWAVVLYLWVAQGWALTLTLVDKSTGKETVVEQTDVLSWATPKPLETKTPWTDKVEAFKGIYLAELLKRFDINRTEGNVTLIAWNDYSVVAPLSELLKGKAFLAASRNGEVMKLRDKGPFWLIFDWQGTLGIPKLDSELWSVWQIKRIEVE